jgi:hypothetical protein
LDHLSIAKAIYTQLNEQATSKQHETYTRFFTVGGGRRTDIRPFMILDLYLYGSSNLLHLYHDVTQAVYAAALQPPRPPYITSLV